MTREFLRARERAHSLATVTTYRIPQQERALPMARIVSVSEQVRMTTPTTASKAVEARKRRTRRRGAQAGTRIGDGWRRSADDERLLEWSTRLGAITIRQAHRYIYPRVSYQTARKRVAAMAQAGLVQRLDTLPWAGTVIWPTTAGRQAVTAPDSPLRALEVPADSTMLHRLLVAEEALKLLAAGKTVITEREIRLYETVSGAQVEDRNQFLVEAGLRRSIDGKPGVVPAVANTKHGRVERWLTVPLEGGKTSFRIPDLLEVTAGGELRAVEVEIAQKSPSRMRDILAGYRDACLAHNSVLPDVGYDLPTAGALRRQFRGVRWVVTDPVMIQLRGHPGGVNPVSGKVDTGLVRKVWADSLNTHLFYEKEDTWALRNKGWPLSATALDVSHDKGLEYQLCQRALPTRFRTSMTQWWAWRRVWEKDVADDANPAPFVQWLRAPGNLKRCQEVAMNW